MIIVIFILAVLALIGSLYILDQTHHEGLGGLFTVCSIAIIAVCFIATIVLTVEVSALSTIDTKIAMYEEENTKIEAQIAEVVKQYQEHEKDMFIEVAPESAVTLVSLYPELKSDTLVQKQIEIYIANNDIIKSLKESKINGSVMRWWLYFGH